LWEEYRLRVFGNRVLRGVFGVLRGIFGATRDEVTGEWRQLHNEELKYLYFLTHYCAGDKIEKHARAGAWSEYGGEKRGVCRVLVGKPAGKRSLDRPRCTWEANIWMDLQEVGCGGMD
jgi:hypothetical protein